MLGIVVDIHVLAVLVPIAAAVVVVAATVSSVQDGMNVNLNQRTRDQQASWGDVVIREITLRARVRVVAHCCFV